MAKAKRKLRSEQPLGLKVWSGKAAGMSLAHRHGDLELNYVLDGRMTYLVGSSMVTLPRKRLCAIWGAAPHQMVRTGEPVRAMWVTVPLEEVMRWELNERWMRQLLKQGIIADERPIAGDLEQLKRWQQDLKRGDAADRRVVQLELQARLIRMSQAGQSQRAAQLQRDESTGASSRAVRTMAGFVVAHFRQDVSVEQIAAAAELHPNYAMSLFRKHTGLTLNQYLTRQRVAEAQRLLGATGKSILDIAFDCGFGSVSRFYEAFAHHSGCAPRQFRARMARR